jgi:hypothetical protein
MSSMKEPIRDPAILARMRVAFDLYETAEVMMRQNFRRRHPKADETEIERLFATWLRRLPAGLPGDATGRRLSV